MQVEDLRHDGDRDVATPATDRVADPVRFDGTLVGRQVIVAPGYPAGDGPDHGRGPEQDDQEDPEGEGLAHGSEV